MVSNFSCKSFCSFLNFPWKVFLHRNSASFISYDRENGNLNFDLVPSYTLKPKADPWGISQHPSRSLPKSSSSSSSSSPSPPALQASNHLLHQEEKEKKTERQRLRLMKRLMKWAQRKKGRKEKTAFLFSGTDALPPGSKIF